MLKLSIITVTLNNLEGLKKTVKSVQSQTFKNFEHIIIDGCSSDSTLDYLTENKNLFSHVVSKKDKGIYDAMNKGYNLASGEYLHFLNAADSYFEETSLSKLFSFHKNHLFFYTDIELVNNNFKQIIRYPETIDSIFLYQKMICHQACFYHRDIFKEIGGYDLTYKFCSDYYLLLKLFYKKNIVPKKINITAVKYDNLGISSKIENANYLISEKINIQKIFYSENEIYLINKVILLENELNLIKNSKRYKLFEKIKLYLSLINIKKFYAKSKYHNPLL